MPDPNADPAAAPAPGYSLLVPMFDERDAVADLLEEIERAMHGLAYEVVVVDDGSRDGTAARLAAAARRHAWLRVVSHASNLGQSAALCSAADAARGEWLVTLDGDGQNDPADIPCLLRCLADTVPRPQLVCGHRRRRHDDALRRLSSRLANAVRAMLLADGVQDTGCGLKLIARRDFQRLPRFEHMHRFLPALVLRAGGRVATVDVGHRPRRSGRSKYGIRDRLGAGLIDLAGMLWLMRRPLPRAAGDEQQPPAMLQERAER